MPPGSASASSLRGHVHAVAVDVLAGHDHVADVDADAQLHGVVRLETHLALNIEARTAPPRRR